MARNIPRQRTDAGWTGLDGLPLALALLDGGGCVLRANVALGQLLGCEPASLVGRPLAERLNAIAIDVEDDAIGGGVFHLPREAGDVWLRLTLTDLGGQPAACLADITAERALERLQDACAARDLLTHDAEVGAWRYDPDADAYIFSSELSLGHQQSNAPVPRSLLTRIQHPDDVAKDAAIIDRLASEGGTATAEIRYRHAEQGWRHLRVHFRSGRRTASGRYEVLGLSQNVTTEALARDEAAANASRLRLALTGANAGVYEYDYLTYAFWVSPEFRTLTGRDSLDTSNALDLFHEEDRALVVDLHHRASRDAHAAPVDVRLRRPGPDRWVRLYLDLEKDAAGQPIRSVGLMLDIGAQKRQELALTEARRAAEAATAAKSTFLASVSHEIRTPMNGIVGVLNLLKREPLTDEASSLLGEAIGCSEMLAELINDVLDFSKIEAGKLELSPAAADPAAIVEGVTNLIRGQAEAKGLYLRLIAEDGIGHVSIDSVRLRQCLFNIIGNAVKFTERGGVEVRLSATGEGAGRRLRCEIEDSGIGVAEAARATLFDRFQQADRSITRRFGGTGLGLAISSSLVGLMGGELDFSSRPGQGSTFWFEIAAPQVAAPASTAEEAQAEAPLAGLLILVVDDNRVNRLVAVKSLEALGAEAEAVDSGAAAIEAVEQTNFDLVLMDINMPEMDGMEATRRIRALPSQAAGIPVIALTADVMSHHRQAYRMAGMDGVVPKPFSPALLLAEIAKIAERSEEGFEAVG